MKQSEIEYMIDDSFRHFIDTMIKFPENPYHIDFEGMFFKGKANLIHKLENILGEEVSEEGKKAMLIINNIECNRLSNEENEAIVIVNNLIQKQQEEIKHWKNGFERELDDNRENTLELIKKDKEIEKKDKIINEMADYIINLIKYYNSDEDRDVEEIKQYFINKVEEEK